MLPYLGSGAVAETSHPTSQVRGGCREEQPHVQGMAAAQVQRAKRSYSTFKVRSGGCEEIPLIQGTEQRLRFSGAAVKRYPTHVQGKRNPSMMVGVARGHQRADTLKP